YEYRIGNAGINVHIDTLLQVLKDTVNIEGFDYAGFDYAIEATPNGKPIIIIPKKKGDRFKLYYSLTEFIREQINLKKMRCILLIILNSSISGIPVISFLGFPILTK